MLRLNTELDSSGAEVLQRDHTFGAVQVLDGLQFSAAWLDWNDSPDNNIGYRYMSLWASPFDYPRRSLWSAGGVVALGTLGELNGNSIADYHIDASARLHVHHVLPEGEGPLFIRDLGLFQTTGLLTQTAAPMDDPSP